MPAMAISLTAGTSLGTASSFPVLPSSSLLRPSRTTLSFCPSSSSSSTRRTPWSRILPVLKLSSLSHGRQACRLISCCSDSTTSLPSKSEVTPPPSKSEEYNRTMQRQMRNPYEYHHDLGIYYTRILDSLIVGSQPQTENDIDRLYQDEGVRAILNLQQDKDIEYWQINISAITKRCDELGIQYMRTPARDFDPTSLRTELPRAVSLLDWAICQGKTVYVHCSAGLGRAPGVAIAYLFWFNGMNLDGAYNFLTSKRPCGPRKEAIRGATYDLAKNDAWKEPFEQLPEHAFSDVAPWERQLIQERIRSMR